LSYSRLGTGDSEKANDYLEIQAPIELELLTQLTTLLRAGKLHPEIPAPKKVVHVGHSYGSLLTNALAASAPTLTDGVILTGFTLNTTWQRWFLINTGFNIAKNNEPVRFADYGTGSLIWPNKYHNQFSFLKYPNFDPAVLDKAEATKQPFTIGELLTGGLVPVIASNFTGPALVSRTSLLANIDFHHALRIC